MAELAVYQDLNLQNVSQLKGTRIHNLTNAERSSLGGSLNTNHIGLLVYDTEDDLGYFWDGSAWVALSVTISGTMVLKGVVAHNAVEPSTPDTGDYYVFNSAGTNTWETSVVVEAGDMVVWDGTNWQYIQTNIVQSSETNSGVIELATQSEVNTGTDAVRAVTPATLQGKLSNYTAAKVYFETAATVTANTPYTVTHNLGLQNRNAFCINIMSAEHSAISVDVDSTSVNALTITSAVTLTNVGITVIGF